MKILLRQLQAQSRGRLLSLGFTWDREYRNDLVDREGTPSALRRLGNRERQQHPDRDRSTRLELMHREQHRLQ